MSGVTTFAVRQPHPLLAEHVVLYIGHDRTSTEPTRRVLAALGAVVVGIEAESPVRLRIAGSPTPADVSPVSGLSSAPMGYEMVGREHGVLVELTPAGAHALFGLPLRVLAGGSVGLADLLGPHRARRLAERVAEAPDWEAAFDLLDRWLVAAVLDGPELDRRVRHAWQRLVTSAGRVRVDALADEVGWSRQHLNARFGAQVGLPPKTVGRIARCHRAIRMRITPGGRTWADVAAACDYAD
ncbi:MAG TPA: helix-turn-helix domain-containing protein, partial [Umezawaea sp.]|nr:helix-turn-helix domain-containing protein [Umezawaea sp.]